MHDIVDTSDVAWQLRWARDEDCPGLLGVATPIGAHYFLLALALLGPFESDKHKTQI